MSCKKWRGLLGGAPKRLDAARALSRFGYRACRRLGVPRAEGVTAALAAAGDLEGLVAAWEDGCPVGPGVAAEGARLGDMDLLVWAWRRGAELDATVARCAGGAPPHVIRWLALQGCPMRHAVRGAAAADNVGAVRQIARDCGDVPFAWWMEAYEAARARGSRETVEYIRKKFDLLAA